MNDNKQAYATIHKILLIIELKHENSLTFLACLEISGIQNYTS